MRTTFLRPFLWLLAVAATTCPLGLTQAKSPDKHKPESTSSSAVGFKAVIANLSKGNAGSSGKTGGTSKPTPKRPPLQPAPVVVPPTRPAKLPTPVGASAAAQQSTADRVLPLTWADNVVSAKVPSGIYQVALEVQTASGTWHPLGVQHYNGSGGNFVAKLPKTPARGAQFRARAYTVDKFDSGSASATHPTTTAVSAEASLIIPDPIPVAQPVVALPQGIIAPADAGIGVYVIPGISKSVVNNTILSSGVLKAGSGALTVADTYTMAGTGVLNTTLLAITGITKVGRSGTLTLTGAATATVSMSASASSSAVGLGSVATNTGTVASVASLDSSLAAPVAVESDIWKFVGERLYYFNQYRGLQVIDIHDPSQPVKLGTLRLPAVGDQIQVLDADGKYLALFVRSSGGGWQSQIKIIAISEAGEPSLAKEINLDGQLGETRMIGSRLYVMISGSWYDNNKLSTLRLQGFDLTDPAKPVDLGFASGTGYQPVLQDAGRYLLVATDDYNQHAIVHAIDISGDGHPKLVKAVKLIGYMHDQFKMGVVDHAVVGVSQIQTQWVYGPSTSVTTGSHVEVHYQYTIYPAKTYVETFSLDDDSTAPLAQLYLDDAEGENLYAARFDNHRLYVVTYGVRQKGPKTFDVNYSYNIRRPCDPLYIIDLTDPAKPLIRGQLEIPGYSTFIECQGDRLLSVGRDNNNVAASLFDVSDPDSPSLLSRVYPGSQNGCYSWSESETEHRAVTWLRDQQKFFVPYQSWTGSGYQSATQEVDYTNEKLTLGDTLSTVGTARRGTSVNGYLLTISGRELVAAKDSATGSGSAKPVATLTLAWPVDRIVAVGDYLIEIETYGTPYQSYWGLNFPWYYPVNGGCRAGQKVVLRLARRDDSERILDAVELEGDQAPVVGVSVHGGQLYLAQAKRSSSYYDADLITYVVKPVGNHIQQIASVSTTLPCADVSKTGTVTFDQIQALWVQDNQLVWYVPCAQRLDDYYWTYPCCYCPDDPNKPSDDVIAWRHRLALGWGKAVAALVCPVTVGENSLTTPVAALSVQAAPGESVLVSTSRAFTNNGRLFFSSTQEMDHDSFERDDAMVKQGDFPSENGGGTSRSTLLHELNFNAPVVLEELGYTALPDALLGVSQADDQGAWLLSWAKDGNPNSSGVAQVLSLAYDGVMVRRKDKAEIPAQTQAVDSNNGLLITGTYELYGYHQNQKTGKLKALTAVTLPSYVDSIRINGNYVLAANSQFLAVARINVNRTITLLGSQTWPGYGPTVASKAVLDTKGAGAWVPLGDYGTEWMPFAKPEANGLVDAAY